MTEHGLEQVEAAKADGRWDRAYGSGRNMEIPGDLQAAIDAEPKAKEMLEKLSEQNRFALAFRIHNMKTEAGRSGRRSRASSRCSSAVRRSTHSGKKAEETVLPRVYRILSGNTTESAVSCQVTVTIVRFALFFFLLCPASRRNDRSFQVRRLHSTGPIGAMNPAGLFVFA